MYEQYFAFQRSPFSIAPDPSFLYPSPQHRDGLEQLLYGIKKEGGFIVLTGEVGTGKTTLCRLFIQQLPPNVHVATVLNAKLNADDLLSNICKELGSDCDINSATQFQKIEAISEILHRNQHAAKKTLLIIEEAQNLNPDTLETLRLLTNIETDTTKLIHILLIGQPELAATLGRPDLRQLAQRIIARFHLQPLSLNETQNYITHRLSVAGGQNNVFKASAVTALYETAGGIPRLINLIADRSLLNVYNEKSKHANAKHVRTAAALINGNGISRTASNSISKSPLLYIASSAIVLIALAAVLYTQPWGQPSTSIEPAKQSPVANEISVTGSLAPAPLGLVVTTATSESNINAELLKRWQINTATIGSLCSHAELNGLLCLKLEQQSLEDIRRHNRPAIVTVFGSNGQAQATLIEALGQDRVELRNATNAYTFTIEDFKQRWLGDLSLLWKPAPGFIGNLHINEKSFQTVYWLQEALNKLRLIEGKIITGGVYTQLLSDQVTVIQTEARLDADGILGKETIMAINTRLGQVPTLFRAGRDALH